MKEETYAVEGYITIPVALKVNLKPTGNKEDDMQRLAEQVDNILNDEVIFKAEVELTTFSGRKVQLQADDVTVEWESVTLEEEIKSCEKEDISEKIKKKEKDKKEGIPEGSG
jgi:hypothetical protein